MKQKGHRGSGYDVIEVFESNDPAEGFSGHSLSWLSGWRKGDDVALQELGSHDVCDVLIGGR